MVSRKSWKQNFKKFSGHKIKRKRTQLKQGETMQRRPSVIKKRRDTL